MRFGEFELDQPGRQLLRDGRPLRLSPKALALLDVLLERRPAALSKAEIRDRVWPRTFVADSNLSSLVTELRTALRDDARKPRFLRTTASATPSAERLPNPRAATGCRRAGTASTGTAGRSRSLRGRRSWGGPTTQTSSSTRPRCPGATLRSTSEKGG
jgi:hypothetical protein